MADFDDGDGDTSDFVSNKPWMGVAIPFGIVVAIIFCCAVVFYHRRNLKMQRNGLALDRQGHMALQRDIYPDSYNGSGTRPHMNGYYSNSSNHGFRDHTAHSLGGRRQPRVANRWAWTSNAESQGIRNARPAVQTEGLDEHGQAPPPYMYYDNPQDKMTAETRAVEEHIEMNSHAVSPPAPAHIRRESGANSPVSTASPTSASAGLSPSQAGSSATSTSRPVTLPPAYNDIVTPKQPN